jgi:ParB-like chromosome segregation protein Spo0J
MLARKTELIDVDAIQLGDRLRQVNPEAVASLRASIEKIGLRTPITVRMMDADAISEPMLVSGLHRLEAAKAIGWQQIECFVVDHESDDEARMWEISENLHRAELTALQRSEHIAEWVRLSANLAETRAGRPGDASHAARELNLPERTVRRAVTVDKLSDEAKAAAKETGLDDNQAVLEAARRAPDDVAFLRAEHARREAEKARKEAEALNRDTDAVIKLTAAEDFANWIMARTDLSEMPTIISWLEGTKPKEVIAAMRRIAQP